MIRLNLVKIIKLKEIALNLRDFFWPFKEKFSYICEWAIEQLKMLMQKKYVVKNHFRNFLVINVNFILYIQLMHRF